MSVSHQLFRQGLGCFASGVTVITSVDADGAPAGVTISAFSSLSLDPPLILFCLGNGAKGRGSFSEAGTFTVNILAEGQEWLSNRFASRGGDLFDGVAHDRGGNGCPRLEGCLASLECSVENVLPGGDHAIIVGRVGDIRVIEGLRPLLHFKGAYGTLS